MSSIQNIFPFTLCEINPLDPLIDVITVVYDEDQIPPDPDVISDLDPDANFLYENGNLTRIDFTNGEYKTFTYIDNVGQADHNLLLTLYDSETTTTKTFSYNANGVLVNITVS